MTVLAGQTLRLLKPVSPFHERSVVDGMSFGLSAAGYDVRIAETIELRPHQFKLASTIERFHMPSDLIAFVHDKSTWARRGLAVQNTVIEPGWQGHLTLELTNHSTDPIYIKAGQPIAQIIFHWLDAVAEQPYSGKYQHQEAGPQGARFE